MSISGIIWLLIFVHRHDENFDFVHGLLDKLDTIQERMAQKDAKRSVGFSSQWDLAKVSMSVTGSLLEAYGSGPDERETNLKLVYEQAGTDRTRTNGACTDPSRKIQNASFWDLIFWVRCKMSRSDLVFSGHSSRC